MKNLEEFKQICAGPVWDGDLLSKDARDALVNMGYIARASGWNILAEAGVAVAVVFGFISTNRSQRPGAVSGVLQAIADCAPLEVMPFRPMKAEWREETEHLPRAMLFQRHYLPQQIQLSWDQYNVLREGDSAITRGVMAFVAHKGCTSDRGYYVQLGFCEVTTA